MFYTIDKNIIVEQIIEKSKFICNLKPVSSREEAEIFFKEIRKLYKDATHNVPCCLIGENIGSNYEYQSYSDDGEPSSTAGLPILETLKKRNISNIAVVVTRYFGGIKLGTGGLVRAYTSSLLLALEKADIKKVDDYINVILNYDYRFDKQVNFILKSYFHILKNKEYLDKINLELILNISEYDNLEKKIIDISSNSIKILKKEVIKYMI